MKASTLVRSWPAIGLGIFFTGITGRVLFDDVLAGAPVTTTHALSLAALVAALASGHKALPELKARRVVTGAALALLFLASTAYVVVSSGARNAEVAASKAAAITTANEARASAKAKLDAAERDLPAVKVFHTAAVADAAAECKSGRGKRCDGTSATRDAAAKNVETGESHVKVARQELARLKPEIAPNAGYAHAAKVLAALGLGNAPEIEARLVLVLPFVVVLIAELGTIVFVSMGIGHGAPARIAGALVAANDAGTYRPKPRTSRRGATSKDARVVAFVEHFRIQHGRNPAIPDMLAAFPGMATSTAQRYRKADGGNIAALPSARVA
jgi:hypothetical protein